ncbi:hypothetical protein IV203_026856 [Nitzschia inconspicua]|uniref:Uncharacterized protein n=1 Tax=Nitzschia inconspicua TaxID=303405 RepID=A0A9K3LKP6_9STRA|nr:hypothetical protein IV203_026856 [Nitzschia inconspicua]
MRRRLFFSPMTVPLAVVVGFFFHLSDAFQSHSCISVHRPTSKTADLQRTSTRLHLSSTPLRSSPADANASKNQTRLRDRLRKVTGFSLTVFRATIRGITGLSLTAIYASTVAATGQWIRSVSSFFLSIFPSWFRYFLQPILVLYYAPLFMLRNLTGPTRQRARKKHATVLESWKEAVEFAEKTEQDGYWPVVVSEDGYFEMVVPPNPDDTTQAEANRQFSNAMAETVEKAMEVKDADNEKNNTRG